MLFPGPREVSGVRGAEQTSRGTGGFARRLGFVAAALAAAACTPRAAQVRPAEIVRRGVLIARGWSVAPLVKGPALVHVYTEAAGGTVYITPKATGTGKECSVTGPAGGSVQARLEPDKRMTVVIREGEVVCLSTQARRTVEVLWHAHRVPPEAPEYQPHPAALIAKP